MLGADYVIVLTAAADSPTHPAPLHCTSPAQSDVISIDIPTSFFSLNIFIR